jgi:ABC-2 type transport system permease protein
MSASPAARGPLALVAHQARYDLLASLRNPRARFFTFAFPILLLVIFAGVFGNGKIEVDGERVVAARFWVPGILALSIVTASFGALVISIATAREAGVYKRRRATPVPAWVLVAGQVASSLAIGIAMSAILLVIARFGYGVAIPAIALAAVAVTVIVGTLALSCIGFAIAGLVGSPDAAQPVAQALMLPLYFISGVWIPTSQLPHGLRAVGRAFPIYHLAEPLHVAFVRSTAAAVFKPADLASLALWGAGAAFFASRRFSWLPRQAGA